MNLTSCRFRCYLINISRIRLFLRIVLLAAPRFGRQLIRLHFVIEMAFNGGFVIARLLFGLTDGLELDRFLIRLIMCILLILN